jgi:hypothetical protein
VGRKEQFRFFEIVIEVLEREIVLLFRTEKQDSEGMDIPMCVAKDSIK